MRVDAATLRELAALDHAGNERVRRDVRAIRKRLGPHEEGTCGGRERCALCRVEAAERRTA